MKRMKGSRTFMALILAVVMILGNALAGTYYIDLGDIEVYASETSQTVTQRGDTQNDNAPVISHKYTDHSVSHTVTIKADDGCTANVTVKDLNIDIGWSRTPALKTEGAGNVNIELDGDSRLKGGPDYAGLQKENTGNLTINDADQNGKLEAEGGNYAAGIGGGLYQGSSNIIITGGEIIATGGDEGAGIGGGRSGGGVTGNGENITITGGEVTATGGKSGAGIGGGLRGKGNNIKIEGCAQVNAAGGAGESYLGTGAAIGDGGKEGSNGSEIELQADALTCGSIEYYDPGTSAEDIQNGVVSPNKTVQGTKEHTASSDWTGNSKTHWHSCTEPGCVARINEGEHTPVTDPETPPTCTDTGLTRGSHCSTCGRILTKQETIPARNHTWDTGWTSDGAKHWHKCLNDGCTEIKDEAAHTPGEPVIENEKPARVGKAGSYDIVVRCSACGREMSRETVTTDPLPEEENKKMPQGNLAALCAEMAKQIRQAPENGTVEMDAGSFDGLTRVVFKALGERPDVTLKLQTKEGLITIPAGAGLLEKIGKKNTVSFTELKDILK